jgi:hypothetical protein
MVKPFRVPLALLLSCLLLTIVGPRIAAGMIVTTVIDLPVEVTDTTGRMGEQTIKVTIIQDNARPKSSFLMLNHGRGSTPRSRAKAAYALISTTRAISCRKVMRCSYADRYLCRGQFYSP